MSITIAIMHLKQARIRAENLSAKNGSAIISWIDSAITELKPDLDQENGLAPCTHCRTVMPEENLFNAGEDADLCQTCYDSLKKHQPVV